MTRERMRWYCDALETTASNSGQFVVAEPTIHTDDDYARSQGLPGIIADGMISTNWISSMLVREFGMDYIARGELRTKFIRPIYEDETISAVGRVTGVEPGADGTLFTLDVWVQLPDGEKCTVGEARVLRADQA